MAIRRMIAKSVIQSDAFMELPYGAQALYFQIQVEGDEFGFIESPTRIARAAGIDKSFIDNLVDSGFLIVFESGVALLPHWDLANSRNCKAAKEPRYKAEYRQIMKDENGVYYRCETMNKESESADSNDPIRDKVIDYMTEKGVDISSIRDFLSKYGSTGWMDAKGNQINWRTEATSWILNHKKSNGN